jgi:hypothetical protein
VISFSVIIYYVEACLCGLANLRQLCPRACQVCLSAIQWCLLFLGRLADISASAGMLPDQMIFLALSNLSNLEF